MIHIPYLYTHDSYSIPIEKEKEKEKKGVNLRFLLGQLGPIGRLVKNSFNQFEIVTKLSSPRPRFFFFLGRIFF